MLEKLFGFNPKQHRVRTESFAGINAFFVFIVCLGHGL